jgi:predicted HicB family RNase H-like nuclease
MKRGKLGNSSLKNMTSKNNDVETSSLQDNVFAASDEDKRMTLRIQKSGWVQLNLLHLEQGRTVNELITAAINDYLEKHGKPPVA